MKILYLHPRAWTGEYSVLKHLSECGHKVFALEEDRQLTSVRRITPYFKIQGDGICTFWYNPRRGLERLLTWPWDRYYRRAFDGRNLAHRVWIIRAATSLFKPDIVVTSDGFSYAVPAAWLRSRGYLSVPLVASYIGGDILDFPEAQVGKRRTKAVNRLIHLVIEHADVLRPVSPLLAEVLLSEGARSEKIQMCPSHLVVDQITLQRIYDDRERWRTTLRARLGIDEHAPLIITLSGNLPGKGLQILAAAWPKVLKSLPQARWLLCGPFDPWLDEAVWPRLTNLGVTDTVIATGVLEGESVFKHLAAADLHVNPSLGESLNMVTVEAAAVGTPTIGTDHAGISAWISRYGTGEVVPAGEVVPLANAIIHALNEPERLGKYGAACREMASEFALERIAEQLKSVFENAHREPNLEH